jgi:hypothetical protein
MRAALHHSDLSNWAPAFAGVEAAGVLLHTEV